MRDLHDCSSMFNFAKGFNGKCARRGNKQKLAASPLSVCSRVRSSIQMANTLAYPRNCNLERHQMFRGAFASDNALGARVVQIA